MSEKTIVKTELSAQVLKISPGKTLDNDNALDMISAITSARNLGHIYILVDMAEMKFLSSAGVGSILGTVDSLREAGGDIILYNIPDVVQNVLSVLDLIDYLTIAGNEEKALAHCQTKVKQADL